MSKKSRNVTNVTNPQPLHGSFLPFRKCFRSYVSLVVWLGQIHNLDTGHVYLLGLKSGSERLSGLIINCRRAWRKPSSSTICFCLGIDHPGDSARGCGLCIDLGLMSKRPVGGGVLVSVGASLHFLQILRLHVAVWHI